MQQSINRAVCAATLLLTAVTLSSADAASTISKYGIDFCVIGAVGNRGTNQTEAPGIPSRGAVGHAYAISRNEITIGQWYEFANAYGKYIPLTQQGSTFRGLRGIGVSLSNPSHVSLLPGFENIAAEVGWRYTAMYCNWLHNNKVNEKWAFESGAYDVSTFTSSNGKYFDQPTHSAGAKFWIPSLDEWIKSAYYDPNRYGDGNGGYWTRPGGRDTFLQPGTPQNGGETSAATGGVSLLNVGSYPAIGGPWGLLDTSGGVKEWSEFQDRNGLRSAMGTKYGESQVVADAIDWEGLSGVPDFSLAGIRLATEVPAPATACIFAVVGSFATRKRSHI
ncbi:MAG: SUMF1/EgtB/PvdO family nonheme iron enzyme [Phycisphaerales bacterium]